MGDDGASRDGEIPLSAISVVPGADRHSGSPPRLTITPKRPAPKPRIGTACESEICPRFGTRIANFGRLCENGRFFEACKSPGCSATQLAGTLHVGMEFRPPSLLCNTPLAAHQ
jgi:hypothetical protein